MRRSAVAIAALGLLVASAAPSRAAVVTTGPGGFVAGFAPPVVVIAEGEGITLVQGDIAPHNFIAVDAFVPKKKARKVPWCSGYPRGKCPLFWSDTITAGGTTEVQGLERVRSGKEYAFHCSIHPNMQGTLIVR